MSDPAVISLFSGAGGMDLGVENAGGSVRVFVESDSDCVKTLERNRRYFPSAQIIPKPIEKVSSEELLTTARLVKGECALLVGGPPCQPFSKSGYWLKNRRHGLLDPRATLLRQFLRVVSGIRPEGFMLENVASLMHPEHRPTLEEFKHQAKQLGYTVEHRLLHAVEFGVPQNRPRLFVLALRGRESPHFPAPSHWWDHRRNGTTRRLRPPETAGRWIADLDRDELFEPAEVVKGKWANHLHEIPPGQNYKYHTAWAGHPHPTFITESKYWTFLLKLSPYRPSWTIQASAGPWTGPFHWKNRRLRIPELAALQTFPRGYIFRGDPTAQRRQIGNAVPCILALKVATMLLKDIAGKAVSRRRRLRYRLAEGYDFNPNLLRHRGIRW
jgi:DNA (cytosine-5)-methyltransferase 1